MRINSEQLDIFRSMAKGRGMTQIEFLEAMIRDQNNGKTIEMANMKLEEMKQELEIKTSAMIKMEKKYGHPVIAEMRRVTFAVTNKQFAYIDEMAYKLKTPKKYLLRDHLFQLNKIQLSNTA